MHKKLMMDKVPLKQCYRYVSTVAKDRVSDPDPDPHYFELLDPDPDPGGQK